MCVTSSCPTPRLAVLSSVPEEIGSSSPTRRGLWKAAAAWGKEPVSSEDSDPKLLLPQVQNDQCQPNADDARWMRTTEKGWEFHSVSEHHASSPAASAGDAAAPRNPRKGTKGLSSKECFLPARPPPRFPGAQGSDMKRMLQFVSRVDEIWVWAVLLHQWLDPKDQQPF